MMLGSSPIFPLPAPLPPAQVAEGCTDTIMDEMDESKEDQNKIQMSSSLPVSSVATHTGTIRIIYPPPDIRTIVDTTARYVAKKGLEFEKLITSSNYGNAKFNFLTASDPYHAYYQHRLSEVRAQPSGESASEPTDSALSEASSTAESNGKPDHSAQFRVERRQPLEPPEAEHYTVRLPEGITGEELDVIKLTAQFVARNGRSFLTGLNCREMNNPQFGFLKPTHSMAMFFTSLVDAYSKVLMPPNDLKNNLEKSVTHLTTILERCIHRLGWEKSQEQALKKSQECLPMAVIDWHDFVVVESIDFADDEDDDLPPPVTLVDVMHGVQPEEIVEAGGNEVEMEMDDEEVQLVEDGSRAAVSDDAKVVVEQPEPPMRIVENWKRPEERPEPAKRDLTKYVISPITCEAIPISEMSEHIRISLIDPKYKEQKERMFFKIRETTLAQDDEISRNIVGLARTRPDIFGTTDEEVCNAVKAEIEKKNTVQYSAPTSGGILAHPPRPPVVVNMMPDGMRPPPPPMHMIPGQQTHMLIRPPRSIPVPPPPGPQFTPLAGYHQSFTTQAVMPLAPPTPMYLRKLPPPPMYLGKLSPPPMSLGKLPLPPPEEAPLPLPEEPEPKRQKLDDSKLIPEEQFMSQHPGPARINIAVPNHDEGNLNGQVVEITLPSLSETVASLKEKIAGEIQLPANKQKLCGKAGFLKDNLSLAYYNVSPSDTLSLSLRERGGRKR